MTTSRLPRGKPRRLKIKPPPAHIIASNGADGVMVPPLPDWQPAGAIHSATIFELDDAQLQRLVISRRFTIKVTTDVERDPGRNRAQVNFTILAPLAEINPNG